ncbi:MAG: PHP domain-containing protein, partial [Deltaproteobacteria bacterium]|nr:PHP domain-containing protein [Deltaproteobacteria bacterium]
LPEIGGVGKGIATLLRDWILEEDMSELENIIAQLPRGLDELLKVPGLGMKKIRTLYQKMGIATLEDLLDACNNGTILKISGFSGKTAQKIREDIGLIVNYRGKYLLDRSLNFTMKILSDLKMHGLRVDLTGQMRRTREIIDRIEFLVVASGNTADIIRRVLGDELRSMDNGKAFSLSPLDAPEIRISLVSQADYALRLFLTTGNEQHVAGIKRLAREKGIEIDQHAVVQKGKLLAIHNEADIYSLVELGYIPAELREWGDKELVWANPKNVTRLLDHNDLKGTLHVHTGYSDGRMGLREMVLAARDRGYSWIGISDHSHSAYYAGGMDIEELKRQLEEIDELNATLAGIKVLKGIESDILPDGSLDYPPEVLQAFDFVIASIHSQMDMDRDTMTNRIIQAIKNPYTSILGHPTGRLLLARKPYEVDMPCVIEAALDNSVIIELNANPQRLDLDWRLIPDYLAAGGVIAITPDAHDSAGLGDMDYGVMMARKGFVEAEKCLNTYEYEQARILLRAR